MCDPAFGPDMGLSHPELLTVRTWRKMVFSRGACPSIGAEFGTDGRDDVADAIGHFLTALGQGSRHRLTIGHPGCLQVTADEHQMLALIAACQSGNDILLQSHLSWLVRPCQRKSVEEAARGLADTLDMLGFIFPTRQAGSEGARPRLALVHERARASLH